MPGSHEDGLDTNNYVGGASFKAAVTLRVQVPGLWVIVLIVQALGKSMTISYLDLQGNTTWKI